MQTHAWTCLAALVLLAGCDGRMPQAQHEPAAQSGADARQETAVGFQGYGPVQVGMTPAEAAAASALDLRPGTPDAAAELCYYLVPGGDFAADPAFMVSDGRIARVDVDQPGFATAEGATVGDSEARILELYPDAEVTPHKYGDPGDHYLTVRDATGSHAMVFETAEGVVRQIRAGRLPEAGWIEGCS